LMPANTPQPRSANMVARTFPAIDVPRRVPI
jgi:hypothetical protein